MVSNSPAVLDWLDPLPIQYRKGVFFLANDTSFIEETFETVTDEAHPHPRNRIPRRILEVRRALAQTLRYAHNPTLHGRGPWVPADPRYTPFRSIITPLLSQPLWETARVIAAPFLTYMPRARVAGIIDVILQFPDGSTAVAILQCSRRSEDLVSAARTELGGAVAALIDHRTLVPTHALTIWAAADNTEVEYHHPDICLGLWIDALDLVRWFRQKGFKAGTMR